MWRSADFATRQVEAKRRGIPPILVVTLPKSGSLFLLNTLTRGLSAPHLFLSPLGMYPDAIIEERVRDFSAGGSIAVDHIWANDRNLDILHRYGVRKIVFHYRDLRQAALSHAHHSISDEIVHIPRAVVMKARHDFHADSKTREQTYRMLFHSQLPYLVDWARRIASDDRFSFLVSNFDDLQMEENLVRRLLSFHDLSGDSFDWHVLDSDKKERAGHFRKGLREEWREVLSQELQAEIDGAIDNHPVLSRLESH
jgi:hypothetical protein